MSKPERRALRNRDQILEALGRLDEKQILELARRGRHRSGADGFPAATIGPGTSFSAAQSSVEGAVVRMVDTGPYTAAEPDPVGQALREIFYQLEHMAASATVVDRLVGYVRHMHERSSGRVSRISGDCLACERPVAGGQADPLRGGYCNACRMAWERAERPDRAEFERSRPKWTP